jgi:hypothetical protein
MMDLNKMGDVRDLEVGSIFLVPPHDGTYTPTPHNEQPTATPGATDGPSETPQPTRTPVPSPTPWSVATAMQAPLSILEAEFTPTDGPVVIAALPTKAKAQPVPPTPTPGVTIVRSGQSPWLVIALFVQVGILALAGVEFFRRTHRKR